MVVIGIKYKDGDGFLFETTTDTLNDDLIKSLVDIHNARLHATCVLESVQSLIQHDQNLDKEKKSKDEIVTVDFEDTKGTDLDSVELSNETNGLGDTSELHRLLNKSIDALKEYLDKTKLQNRTSINLVTIEDQIDNIRGAMIRLYPLGLPKSDALMALNWGLDHDEDQDNDKKQHHNFPAISEMLVESDTKLWCAGKEFVRGQRVSDRLGTNEKTRVICKLVKTSDGTPMREPVVNEKEREAMMKYYFKRQEELKRLAENEGFEDDYLNSEWADPKQMKRSLQGISNITVTGSRFL